jgi:hypothetical protein
MFYHIVNIITFVKIFVEMRTRTFFLPLIIVVIVHCSTIAQTVATKSNEGAVEIIQDPQIKELLDKYIEICAKSTVKGYRVKIHFGNDKAQAYEIKEKFNGKFADIPAYVRYDQPYFSVRVGNYRTKLEAYKFLKQIQSEYPTAFLVQDQIELTP